jgi:hypothetical protein
LEANRESAERAFEQILPDAARQLDDVLVSAWQVVDPSMSQPVLTRVGEP